MSERAASTRVSILGCSLVGAGAFLWLLRRRCERHQHVVHTNALNWRVVPPKGASDAKMKAFGETNLQARLESNRFPPHEMRSRAEAFLEHMDKRRTLRFFSKDDVPRAVVETCLLTAGTSPSGAHHQPWYFVILRRQDLKQRIRELVEAEELINYERRMNKSWIQDLGPMTGAEADSRLKSDGGAPQKPYLTEAPVVIAMFKQTHGVDAEGHKVDNYYVQESCGIAAGFLIAALHNIGLATLTSTPMGAEKQIRELLQRPDNEKLFLLLPVGYPADDATVPYRTPIRKPPLDLFTTL